MRPLRIAAIVLLLVLVGGSIAAWPSLPGQIPTHFGLTGRPDSYATKSITSWFVLPLIGVLTWALVAASSYFAIKHPQLLNIPEKQAYIDLPEENRPPVARHIRDLLDAVGVHILLVFGIIQFGVYRDATGNPVTWLVPTVLVTTALLLPVVFFVFQPRIRDEIEAQQSALSSRGRPHRRA